MAIINPLFGRMKGKYGGSVMYSNNGKQCMRERVLQVRNPRSSKQAIQRCIMATVNQFVTAFTPVLNNAIESETSRARNLAKIRSYNLNILRQLAANGDGAYCPRGAQFVAPNDYLISRGTLRGMIPLRDAAARNYLATRGGLVFPMSDLSAGDVTLTASSVFPSISVGDQITILASMTEDISEGSLSAYARFAFKDDVTPALVMDDEAGVTKLNPAAIDLSKAAGDWQNLVFVFDAIPGSDLSAILVGGLVLGASANIQCAGVIVSREAERKRSTSYMVSKTPDEYLLDEVYPTYMGDGTPIDMPSEVYLNNDAQVTNYFAHLPSSLPYAVTLVEGSRQLVKLSTDVPLDADTGLALTITREGSSVTLNLLYGGSAVSSSTILGSAQWLPSGFLALVGNAGIVSITAGVITSEGRTINID